MRAPDFWKHKGIVARLLAPLGALYNASVAFKAAFASPYRAPMPVICIGNLTAGGSGKTPVAIAIGERLKARGLKPAFLTRGYRGRTTAPLLVKPHHTARIVGDEALLLARAASTIVSRDRAVGGARAAEEKAEVLVMDDGHQNFALAKNLSLVVVDGGGGFLNGMVLPAGPLREKVAQGLKRADAVIIMGDGTPDLAGYTGPVLRAHLVPLPNDLAGRRVFAFAGIGRPQKFYDTLKAAGAMVIGTQDFGDHHFYDAQDLQGLLDQAKGVALVTTEKDLVRIPPERRGGITALAVEARFEDPAALDALLRESRAMNLRYAAEAALFFLFMALFKLLGLDNASALGGWIGRTLGPLLGSDRTARANLAAAFPEKTGAERDAIRMTMWDNLGRVVAEYPHLGKFSPHGPDARIAVQFEDGVTPEKYKGHALMFLSGHFADWEMMPILANQSGYEGATVVRPPNNPLVARYIERQRGLAGPKTQIAKHNAVRRMIAMLKGGKALFMLVDQKNNEGLAVPFFGRDAMTTPAPAALTLKLRAKMVIAHNRRLGGARFLVTVRPGPEFTASGDETSDIQALTKIITGRIEEIVRDDPSQWLWIHRRWPSEKDRAKT